ncbi:DEAD/DEAH box helicase, putative [Plasmodium berghei]|uniref:DEAD/DEAH box helicase, putative n=2 Tax=Plasmodium berghei TaxID=5821 RepID=A0A509AMA4_PLABA|nr:DEAD/DEAH box helicase, putative [Plasmodium berghei ANKA]CXI46359.1 DEAD/DEAH box helicase, putative [Plasmodium berghei]SCM22776.1 DEAD/DEAH box helicase, putative [Plasmodium berghei]SCN25679.1 DEAD/DEAH box helicase, putative [Plasmodium berghei]SCO60604.1 DEAD/DEAH box helicase, putative [Plasmodium berghei]SCO62338.1 DEAD/DEAH box helicase, putative [Plasmodium berghei]|eukprot:XP_034421755.1 DEAD/DEAH box helicase, putative [Plasmodium berghei ANKA]
MKEKLITLWKQNIMLKRLVNYILYSKQNKYVRTYRQSNMILNKDNKNVWNNTNSEDLNKVDSKQNNEYKVNEEEKQKSEQNIYKEMTKKLYKKYNYYEIGSNPHNINQNCKQNYSYISELNIHKMLLLGLKKLNITKLNDMQINTLLTIQQGKDVLLNYPDGSGKTLAYILPILNNIYFIHDYLEKIILDYYDNTENSSISQNYKSNNKPNIYEEMGKYLLKYSHYKNNAILEDNTIEVHKKMNKKENDNFNLLPKNFEKDLLNKNDNDNYKYSTKRGRHSKKSESISNQINCQNVDLNNISIMNKLIEIIKINNINLSNLNSLEKNKSELQILNNILKNGKFEKKKNSPNNINIYEQTYRYLIQNPLQMNKTVIIITINKDNITQIINFIKKIDILNRINIQTLNDVPFVDIEKTSEKEKRNYDTSEPKHNNNDYTQFDVANLQVENINYLNNPVLCNKEIMWLVADILITTPDIFLNSYKNIGFEKNSNEAIIPSIIIFDEVDMLFQNNAYRNTMMNIFQIIKKRPEIYNPHINISEKNIENINKEIDNILLNNSKDKKNELNIHTDIDPNQNNNFKNNEKSFIQLIFISSTLPSVGHTTVGSMLNERFSNLVDIISCLNYKIPKNIQTQWIELNKEKIINLYLFNTQYKNNKIEENLQDLSLSNKINQLENYSFEHRLDILIYILKKYHELTMEHIKLYDGIKYSSGKKQNEGENDFKNFDNDYNKKSKILNNKFELIYKFPIYKTIVFVNNVKDCFKIYNFLKKHNWPVYNFHKNLSLNSRIQSLHNFSNANIGILITTDLLSRGIDTKNVDHIINFHFPSDVITYLHRLSKINRLNSDIQNFKSEKINIISSHRRLFFVTNFISSTNTQLANSIKKFDNNNISLLSLFSRKKSFKMKNKRKDPKTNENKKYIDVDSIQNIELDINDAKLNQMLQIISNEKDKESKNSAILSPPNQQNRQNQQSHISKCEKNDYFHQNENYSNSSTIDTTTSAYSIDSKNPQVQAPFTMFSLNQDEYKSDDESDEECLEKNYANSKYNIYQNIVCDVKRSYKETHNFSNKYSEEKNIKLPSWDNVQFDHQKYVIERFKNKECHLIGQVKRGKLILNNFESNNNDDDLLF